jgi:hypothetical protein
MQDRTEKAFFARAVEDTEEPLGDEVVTLATLGERQLWPQRRLGTGKRDLWRGARKRLLVPYSPLWVEMHKK